MARVRRREALPMKAIYRRTLSAVCAVDRIIVSGTSDISKIRPINWQTCQGGGLPSNAGALNERLSFTVNSPIMMDIIGSDLDDLIRR